jgi:hypothetical protein
VNEEKRRLQEDRSREENWKRWGPYLAERQWGTVREDYSAKGDAWRAFPHDQAKARAYRWGEDGLLGICDRQCRLCFGVALWNQADPILKERLYGLTGPEGNHGEDVKELYYYLDSTPTHSYMKALYKYPQRAFPYAELKEGNASRGLHDRELEITDTDAFADHRYFDVTAEYAKASSDDLLVRITLHNHGPEEAVLDALPQLWFRNTWSWSPDSNKPMLSLDGGRVAVDHEGLGSPMVEDLGHFVFEADTASDGTQPTWLFTENETNHALLFDSKNASPFTKDAFHRHVVGGESDAINSARTGTKTAARYTLEIPAGGSITLHLRLRPTEFADAPAFGDDFSGTFDTRLKEANQFYSEICRGEADAALIQRQAYAGLLWTKQLYHYVVEDWLKGDPATPPPPRQSTSWPQPSMESPPRPRHPLDAGQVGVSVVRRLGQRLSHAPLRRHRPRFCEEPAAVVPARMVSASQRPDSRLRVEVL